MDRLTLILTIIGIGLAILIFNHGSHQVFGIESGHFARLVMLVALLTAISGGIWANRERFNENLRNLAIWVGIFLVFSSAYIFRHDFGDAGTRLMAGLRPGHVVEVEGDHGVREVILHKSVNGHFQADVTVNGQTLDMMLDTGASDVVLSYEDAERIGLIPENLSYTLMVSTANGYTMAAPVRLGEVTIGPITRRNIGASVAQEGRLDESLLGMSFLETLGSLQMQSDELRLRD